MRFFLLFVLLACFAASQANEINIMKPPVPDILLRPRRQACLNNGDACIFTGSIGICCSGYCFQLMGQQVGVCQNNPNNGK